MKSVPEWVNRPIHDPAAWISLIVGGAGILIYEPSIRWALLLMLALGIGFALLFRFLHKDSAADLLTLQLTASPRSSDPSREAAPGASGFGFQASTSEPQASGNLAVRSPAP